MNGFVKLRRGLAEHVSSRRMTLVEHGAYTLLLQLADHSTGRWHGTQRSFAAAAGVSSGLAWKILTSLDRKGYLRWERERPAVQICRFFVGKPVEDPVETPVQNRSVVRTFGHHRNQPGHDRDRYIRNTRTPLEKREVAAASQTISGFPSLPVSETENQDQNCPGSHAAAENTAPPHPAAASQSVPSPAVLAEVLLELRRLALAKALVDGAARPGGLRDREPSRRAVGSVRAAWDRSPP